ncbi:MAG: TlpA family protein disulfide reductase [Calditrichae bacterium]|nr:TlpA family protein disulfide reductase [Calditrichota bacterium]MCB9057439.1 TlpA family protein disulfide reductase [Calditrichia bacterium]
MFNKRLQNGMYSLILIHALLLSPLFSGSYSDESRKAPDFTLKSLTGSDSISLSALRGNVVLVDFWASWCPPCKQSLPYLSELEKKYKNLKVVAVNIDDDNQTAIDFINENNLKLTMVHDSDKSVVSAYDVPEMPTAYLVDQYGKIQYIHSGYSESSIRELEFAVRGLVDKP